MGSGASHAVDALGVASEEEVRLSLSALEMKNRDKLSNALGAATAVSKSVSSSRPLWILEFDPIAAGDLTGTEGGAKGKKLSGSETSENTSEVLRLELRADSHIDKLMPLISDWAKTHAKSDYCLPPSDYSKFLQKRLETMSKQVKEFMPASKSEHISFDVDAVSMASDPLNEVPLTDFIDDTCLCVSANCKLVKPRIIGIYQAYTEHPLLSAVHYAFSQHRPLVLSPDALWLTVAQGVALHVNNETETLRERLGVIGPKGTKEKLQITTPPLNRDSLEAWQEIVEGFAWTVGQQSPELSRLQQLLLCDFSTTGQEERCASAAVFLESVKNYFDYEVLEICGIPCITLEGSVADWQAILSRIDELDKLKLNLEFWTGHLRIIFEHFINAARGVPDIPFWRRIYKIREAYGQEGFTGWISCLFPYRRDNFGAMTFGRKNHALNCDVALHGLGKKVDDGDMDMDMDDDDMDMDDDVECVRDGSGAIVGTVPQSNNEDFPPGISCFHFGIRSLDGCIMMCKFLAGFFGLEQGQGPDKLALRPRIAWAVVEATGFVAQLRNSMNDPRHRIICNTTNRKTQPEWPKDMREFYGEIEECKLHCGEDGVAAGATFVWTESVFTVDATGEKHFWIRVAILPDESGMLVVRRSYGGSAKPEFFFAKRTMEDVQEEAEEEEEEEEEQDEEENKEENETRCDKETKEATLEAKIVEEETRLIETFADVPPPKCVARSLERLFEGLCASAEPYFFANGWELESPRQEEMENQEREDVSSAADYGDDVF